MPVHLPFLWFLVLWLAGWCALPLSRRIFATLPDSGLAPGRVLVLCLWTLLSFWLGYMGVPVKASALLIYPLLAVGAFFLVRGFASLRVLMSERRNGILASEAALLLFFGLFLVLRGYWPDINNGEKPMDMALMSFPTAPD